VAFPTLMCLREAGRRVPSDEYSPEYCITLRLTRSDRIAHLSDAPDGAHNNLQKADKSLNDA
jgi:hypothetical protein